MLTEANEIKEVCYTLLPLLPHLILIVSGLLLLIFSGVNAQRDKNKKGNLSFVATLGSLAFLLSLIVSLLPIYSYSFERENTLINFSFDRISLFAIQITLAASFLVSLGTFHRLKEHAVAFCDDYIVLSLFATSGAIFMIVANEMLTFFISLEVMSLSIYAMSAAAVASRLVREEKTKSSLLNILSSEAALKYFVLGSLASAIMLYGIALIYGLSGSFFFNEIQASLVRVESKLFYLAIGLILAALLFKVGAVPFHYWTPDVYQGAPAPSTAFMSAVVKIAALVVMYKLFWIVFQREVIFWSGVVWLAALLSIIIGSLASLQQSSFRRLIAYSGIANVGYLLGALLVVGREEVADLGPLIYYLSVYLLASGGLLIISSELEARSLSATSSSDIEAGAVKQLFTGLFSRNRFIALAALFFLLTLAGLPPAISGLIGKISVLSAVVKGGYAGLAIISLISSLILAYVYLSIIALIFSKNSQPEESNFYKSNQAFNLSLIACLTMLVLLSAQFSL